MSIGPSQSNYPREGGVSTFAVNRKLLEGTVGSLPKVIALYLGLCAISIFLILKNHRDANFSESQIMFGMFLGTSKLLILAIIGYRVSNWFVEAYAAICGLRNFSRRFSSLQIQIACFLLAIGFLPNAYLAEWLYVRADSHDAPTMTWKSLWSAFAFPNYFGFSIVAYDVLEICRLTPGLRISLLAQTAVSISSELAMCCVLVTGHLLGVATTRRILSLQDQSNFLN